MQGRYEDLSIQMGWSVLDGFEKWKICYLSYSNFHTNKTVNSRSPLFCISWKFWVVFFSWRSGNRPKSSYKPIKSRYQMLKTHIRVLYLKTVKHFTIPLPEPLRASLDTKIIDQPPNLNEICNKILITQRLRPVFHYFFANNLLFNTTIKLLWWREGFIVEKKSDTPHILKNV